MSERFLAGCLHCARAENIADVATHYEASIIDWTSTADVERHFEAIDYLYCAACAPSWAVPIAEGPSENRR